MSRPLQFDPDRAVDKALSLFWEHGFEACSVKMLSEEMGITRSSFYNTFDSREALFNLALDRYIQSSPDKPLFEDAERDIPSLLTSVMWNICQVRGDDSSNRGCLIINCIAELDDAHPIGRHLGGMILGSARNIAALLDRAKQAGDLDENDDTDAMGLTLQTVIIGLNIIAKSTQGPDQLWSVAKLTLDKLGLYREHAVPSEQSIC